MGKVWMGASVEGGSVDGKSGGMQVWEVEVWRGGSVDGRSVEGCRCEVGGGRMQVGGVWRDAGMGCKWGGMQV